MQLNETGMQVSAAETLGPLLPNVLAPVAVSVLSPCAGA